MYTYFEKKLAENQVIQAKQKHNLFKKEMENR